MAQNLFRFRQILPASLSLTSLKRLSSSSSQDLFVRSSVPISRLYDAPNIYEEVLSQLSSSGKRPPFVEKDLVVTEFHVGGEKATASLLGQLNLGQSSCVLDVGCGLGGASRFASRHYGCEVLGVDLTSSFVKAGNQFTELLGGDLSKVDLRCGSALELSAATGSVESFDCAFMLHVGMNIENKDRLFQSVASQLKSGGLFGIYDQMLMSKDGIQKSSVNYPVPWADTEDQSAITSLDVYKYYLEENGFAILAERNRRDFALAFFEKAFKKSNAVGFHLIMNEYPKKMKNLHQCIQSGIVAPVEIIAQKK
eukprot:g254.t1